MNLSGWEPERVTQMCIFAGCDYLKSLSSMGPKRAHAAIFNSSANKAPLDECFVKAIAKLKMEGVLGELPRFCYWCMSSVCIYVCSDPQQLCQQGAVR
jgi:hypothetical protein